MSDLNVTIRLAAPPTFAVEQEAADRLRAAMRRERVTRAEFVARIMREAQAPTPMPFVMLTAETA